MNVLKEIICFLALIYFYGRSSEIKIMVIAKEREEEGSAHLTLVFESLAYRLVLIWIIISNLCKPPKVILMVMPQANGKLNNNIPNAWSQWISFQLFSKINMRFWTALSDHLSFFLFGAVTTLPQLFEINFKKITSKWKPQI